MDTNVNFQQFNGNLPTGNLSYGDLVNLNHQMGNPEGSQPTFINNGNIYKVKDNGNNTFSLQQIDSVANRQQAAAQQQYQAQARSAVSTLTTQRSNLSDQYGSLLQTVTGQYQPLINQTTATAGAEEAKRGLSPDSTLFQQNVQGALQPVYGAEAANAQTIGAGSISDYNALTQAIAGLQSGNAQFGANLGLGYGSLGLAQQGIQEQYAALANALQVAQTYANAPQALGINSQLINPATGNVIATNNGGLNLGGNSTSTSTPTATGGNTGGNTTISNAVKQATKTNSNINPSLFTLGNTPSGNTTPGLTFTPSNNGYIGALGNGASNIGQAVLKFLAGI